MAGNTTYKDYKTDTDQRLKAYENIKLVYAQDFKTLEMHFLTWSGGDTW
ncbi:MAG: hypothetical protein WBJ10_05955 [Daejeonella sp.]